MRIEGFSTYKGIGDGHPIASDIFEIGGHKWVSSGPHAALRRDILCVCMEVRKSSRLGTPGRSTPCKVLIVASMLEFVAYLIPLDL